MFSGIVTAALLGAASFFSPAFAQTSTSCQPLNKTCPADPALSGNYTVNFNNTVDSVVWVVNGQLNKNEEDGGTDFAIGHKGEGPQIQSQFYIFFGHVEVVMRAAKGAGIISCVVLMSDDLDEIDWEFIGSKEDSVETDYFGKGNDTLGNREMTVDVPGGAMDSFHNYTWDWTHERIEWWIDGNLTRTLKYEDALGGKNFPQTPSRLSVGMWSGGDSPQPGTVQWAGGKTDYSKGPFVMTVKSLYVKDYSEGKEYEYGNKTGDWQSIKINEGKPFYQDQIEKGPPKSLSERWKELSKGAKAGIFIGIAVFCAIAVGAIAVCCVIQRKRGKQEYSLAQTEYTSQVEASDQLRSEWQKRHASAMYTRLDKEGSP